MVNFSLEGKIALVTGASYGIGFAIATAYAEAGATIVFNDINQALVDKGLASYKEKGIEAHGYVCDVTDEDAVNKFIAQVTEEIGVIDILVNNAGIYRGGKLTHEFSEEDLDACFNVNVKGSFFGAQEAVKQFLKQGNGGNIINIVSTAGLGGYPNQSVYNISKGAAANLTNSLAVEYGRDKVRVNGICPTYCKTALTRDLYDDKAFDNTFVESIPLGRWGETKDVADLAAFLASDESDYIHGDLIKVDGGERLSRYSV